MDTDDQSEPEIWCDPDPGVCLDLSLEGSDELVLLPCVVQEEVAPSTLGGGRTSTPESLALSEQLVESIPDESAPFTIPDKHHVGYLLASNTCTLLLTFDHLL